MERRRYGGGGGIYGGREWETYDIKNAKTRIATTMTARATQRPQSFQAED
jgi:hypothetical protein